MILLVDSNFFINAHRNYYPLDVVTSFWRKVKDLADNRNIISIDKVRNEIYKNQDDLTQWCVENLPDDFFRNTNTVIGEYTSLARWANSMSHQYRPAALAEFLHADEADAWLVSYAMNQNITLITHEVSAPNSQKSIKIPDVCNQFNVSYLNTIGMFRALEESF